MNFQKQWSCFFLSISANKGGGLDGTPKHIPLFCSVSDFLLIYLLQKKHSSANDFSSWLCEDLTSVCPSAAKAVPSGHKAYPPFVAMAVNGQNVDRILGEMADKGLRGQMFSKDDLMKKYASGELGPETLSDMEGYGGSDGEL